MTTLIAIAPAAPPFKKQLSFTDAGGAPWPDEPSGPITGGYFYKQAIEAKVWTIAHDLNCFPDVTVKDTLGVNVGGTVVWLNKNEVQIVFEQPVAGIAFLTKEVNISKAAPPLEAV